MNDISPLPKERERILLLAIEDENLEKVKYLVDVQHYRGVGMPLYQNAFNYAIGKGNVEIAKFLYSRGHRNDGLAVPNAIVSKSLPMFLYVTNELSQRLEDYHFADTLNEEWIEDKYDEFLRGVFDEANYKGYLDNHSSGYIGGSASLQYAIIGFFKKMIKTNIILYVFDIMESNNSSDVLLHDYNGERDFSLYNLSIKNGNLKFAERLWKLANSRFFRVFDREDIDSQPVVRSLFIDLFQLATEQCDNEVLTNLERFSQLDSKFR
jgi:hypothetical protein